MRSISIKKREWYFGSILLENMKLIFDNLGSIKSPDGQCLEDYVSGGSKQSSISIVLNKNGKQDGGISVNLE